MIHEYYCLLTPQNQQPRLLINYIQLFTPNLQAKATYSIELAIIVFTFIFLKYFSFTTPEYDKINCNL